MLHNLLIQLLFWTMQQKYYFYFTFLHYSAQKCNKKYKLPIDKLGFIM